MSATERPRGGRGPRDGRDGRDGHDRGEGSAVLDAAAAAAARQIDPRAVRVSLAPSVAHANLPQLVVEPLPMPVAPIPSVIGTGILGGTATIAELGPAQRDLGGRSEVLVDGAPLIARLTPMGPTRATLLVEAELSPLVATAAPAADEVMEPGPQPWASTTTRLVMEPPEVVSDGRGVVRREIVVDGWRIELEIESERRAALRDRARRGREESARGGPTEVHAIIPGRIVSVSVVAGEAVVASQQLLVVEAMKMQNELRAPRDGIVSRVAVAPGETIEIGDLLLVLE